MSTTYLNEVTAQKKFRGNVVIQIGEVYFCQREPDSGLITSSPFNKAVLSLSLNTEVIDPRKVSTNIATYTFGLVDLQGCVTALMQGDGSDIVGQPINIWLGRSGVGMDFADYFPLPTTYVTAIKHADTSYVFTTTQQTGRLGRAIYVPESALAIDILPATTEWTMRDSLLTFPSSGLVLCDNEFASYSGIDLTNNRLTGVIRGELDSIPIAHKANAECTTAEAITDNPLNIILKILISNGGGGSYDVLQDGLGLSPSLIDVAGIESLRDTLFNGVTFTLILNQVTSALTTIENELLMPNNLRFTNSASSQLSLAILDKAEFVAVDQVIDEDSITDYPEWDIDATKLLNQIQVDWNYDDGTGVFLSTNLYTDQNSIDTFGAFDILKFQFKGVKASLNGQALVDDFANRLLVRLSTPKPQITVNTHLDKSLQNVGDKAYLQTTKVPFQDGTLNYGADLEIISRSINQSNGKVTFILASTSFTALRSGYIAPSDLITGVTDQKTIGVAAGRSALYQLGWYMRLWDENAQAYTADPPNMIVELTLSTGADHLLTEGGDTLTTEGGDELELEQSSGGSDGIIFQNDWTTTLSAPNNYRIRFVPYDLAIAQQKRYAFASYQGNDFNDDGQTYAITY